MAIESFQKLCALIAANNADYIAESNDVELTCTENCTTLSNRLQNEFGIEAELLRDNRLRFKTTSTAYRLYWNENDYRAKFLNSRTSAIEQDAAIILGPEHSNLYFESTTRTTFVNGEARSDNFFFLNAENYMRFLCFLKEHEHKEDNFFHFVDLFSWDKREVIFVSATKEGKLTVPFKNEIPNFSPFDDLQPPLERFFAAFNASDKKAQLPKFIKAELFNMLAREPQQNRMNVWIDKMNAAMETAEQNFDVYLFDLSLENLKKDYLDYKDKYFGQLREILGKITTQVIGLPLSISAAVIAINTFKNTGTIETILALAVAFVLYSIFAVFLLKLLRADVADIKQRFNHDFQAIEESQFFITYPQERRLFDKVETLVLAKVSTINHTIEIYIVLLILTSSLILAVLLRSNPATSQFGLWAALILAVALVFVVVFVESDAK